MVNVGPLCYDDPMIEVSEVVEVPAVALPEVCSVLLDGKSTVVRVHNATRSGQIWLMDFDPAFVDGRTVDGVVYARRGTGRLAPLARFGYNDLVPLVLLEGLA